jgi:hypothetical protein
VIPSEEEGFVNSFQEIFKPLDDKLSIDKVSLSDTQKKGFDNQYFHSYENLSQHRVMLNDKKRNDHYRNAFEFNKKHF